MAQRKTLTEQQVGILRWISDGCPAGVIEGDSYRISAAALRRRGLVTISGRGQTWSARVTDAGCEYLEKVDSPDPPVARQPNVSVTQQLVNDVIAAGGSLRVPRRQWGDADGVDYENRALLAERYGKVPAGKRLEAVSVDDELEIRLLDAPGGASKAELVEVAVSEKVTRYHPAARHFRDGTADHEVSRAQLRRAVRIVHTIATEAERRDWSVLPSTGDASENERARDDSVADGRLKISAGGHDFGLRLYERGVHPRGPWEEQVKHHRDISLRWGSYSNRDAPSGPYDADATGELNLEVQVDRPWIFRGRQSRWGDRKSWVLEERLPHLFREIEERIVKADRVAEEERIAAEKAAVEAQRAAEERSEWIAWARDFAARLDPLREPPLTPEPPEETPEALQEHLPEGWSVHGPEYGRHHFPGYRRFR